MEEKKKYDTDPLDPEFEQRTRELRGATRDVARTPNEAARQSHIAEDETRRLDAANDAAYQSVFAEQQRANPSPYANRTNSSPTNTNPTNAQTTPFDPRIYTPPVAQAYVPPPAYDAQFNSPARRIAKLGLPENLACMLPYTPFYIGIVISLLELALVPRTETRTRFHAAQGLSLHLAIFAVSFLFRIIGFVTDYHIGGILFSIAAFVFLIVSMIRVYKGEPHRLAPLADLTAWFNQKIEPRG
jgi:uncharacterized membrane protein